MNRLTTILVAAGALSSASSAQQPDPNRLRPTMSPAKHAGVFDMRTGKFQLGASAGAHAAVLQNVYNNTCLGLGVFSSVTECEDLFDEGRVPDQVGSQAYPDHLIRGLELAYCTSAVTGVVDIDWELHDTQVGLGGGGACTFGAGGVPPPFTSGVMGFQSSTAGFPLPGSTATGAQACWIVAFTAGTAGACLDSGAASADLFVFRFAQNNTPTQLGAGLAGPILAGSSGGGAAGCATFGQPPCIDPLNGAPCGEGLDTVDAFWINQDAGTVGGVCATGGLGYPSPGCYWFGGYPANPYASIYLRLEGDGSCTCLNGVVKYCTAKTNSNGCTPAIAFTGPDPVQFANAATKTANFTVMNLSPRPGASSHLGQLFYGTTGAAGAPFLGGTLCVKGLLRVPPLVNTGGTVGSTTLCDSSVTQNFNARIASGSDPKLTAGATVWLQGWARDTAAFQGVQLSHAATFTICP